jgi:hypothetical protein
MLAFLFCVVFVTFVVRISMNMCDESNAAHYEAGRCCKVLPTARKYRFSG